MGFLDWFSVSPNGWKKIDKVPKWVRFPVTDYSNFVFYAKGKNHIYKIEVHNYKTMTQKEEVWKKPLYKKRKFNPNKIYTCKNCGYHQGVSWDGKMRNCKGCEEFNWK